MELTEILKNAVEAIEGREGENLIQGQVIVRLWSDDELAYIEVEDNGKGLPKDNRERLTDPYFTTRSSGTGLGLAIVRKILEDHGGTVELDDGAMGGAVARIQISRTLAENEPQSADPSVSGKIAHGA